MPADFDDYMRLILRGGPVTSTITPQKDLLKQFLSKPSQPADEYVQQDFLERAVPKETERGVIEKVLNALGAGEYAIANALKSMTRGESPLDWFAALGKGFASGFTDDREHETRVYDLLTEWGWTTEKDEGVSFNSASKFVVGFLGGVLADPITYLTLGPAARAVRISGKTIADWARAARIPIDTLRGFGKGQALSKLGRKVFDAFTDRRMTDAAGDLMARGQAQRKAMWDLITLVSPTELLEEGMIRGAKATARIRFPKKTQRLVNMALEAMGQEVSEASVKKFVQGGYRELLDKGGLKWFGKHIWSPHKVGYLTPRLAHFRGFILGERIASNAPLFTKWGAKVKSTEIFQSMVSRPLLKIGRTFNKSYGLSHDLKDLMLGIDSFPRAGGTELSHTVQSLTSFPDPAVFGRRGGLGTKPFTKGLFNKRGLPAVEGYVNHLSPRQSEFMVEMLTQMRHERVPLEDVQRWVHDVFSGKKADWYEKAVEKGLKKWSPKDRYGLVFATKRNADFWPKIRALEVKLGLGDSVSPSYFPKRFRNAKEIVDPAEQREVLRHDPFWWNKEQLNDISPLKMKEAVEQGKVPGPLMTNFEDLAQARLSTTYATAFKRDLVDRLIAHVGIDPNATRMLTDLMSNPEFIPLVPKISQAIHRAAGKIGVSKHDTRQFSRFLARLRKTDEPIEMQHLLEDFSRDEAILHNLSAENIDDLMAMFDESVASKAAKAAGVTEPKAKGAWEKSVEYMRYLREDVEQVLGEKSIDKEVGKLTGELAAAILPEGRKALLTPQAHRAMRGGEHMAAQALGGHPKGVSPLRALHGLDAKELEAELSAHAFRLRTRAKLSPSDQHIVQSYHNAMAKRLGLTNERALQINEELVRMTSGKSLLSLTPSRLFARTKGLQRDVRRQINSLHRKLFTLGQGPMGSRKAQLRAYLLGTEYETLVNIRKNLPGSMFNNDAKHTMQILNGFRQVQAQAAKLGINQEKYLQSALKYYGNGKPLAAMTVDDLDTIRAAMRPLTDGEAIARSRALWDPPVANQAFRKARLDHDLMVTHPVSGENVKLSSFEIPDELAAEMERSWNRHELALGEKMLGWAHGALNSFKTLVTVQVGPLVPLPRPAFYIRNAADLAFRGTIGFGLRFWRAGFRHHEDIGRIIAGETGEMIFRNGDRASYQQLRQWLAEGDVWRTGMPRMARDQRDKTIEVSRVLDKWMGRGEDLPIHTSLRNLKNKWGDLIEHRTPLPSIGKLEGATRWNMENGATVTALVSQIDNGIPVEQALKNIRDHLFSYHTLSETERLYLRMAVPFYTFTKAAIPWTVRLMGKYPAMFGNIKRMSDLSLMTQEDEAKIPRWVRDYPWIGIKTKADSFKVLSMRNTLTVDVVREMFPDGVSVKGFRTWASQLNPLFFAPLEVLFGRDLYLGREIGDLQGRKRIWKELQTPFMQGTLGKFLNAKDVEFRGKKYLAVDSVSWHLLRRLHFSRFFREVDTMANVLGGKVGWETLSGLLTGFKILELDGERQLQILQMGAERGYRAYRAAVKTGDAVKINRVINEYRLK